MLRPTQPAGSGRRRCAQHLEGAHLVARACGVADVEVAGQAAHRVGGAADAGVVLLFVALRADKGNHRGTVDLHAVLLDWNKLVRRHQQRFARAGGLC